MSINDIITQIEENGRCYFYPKVHGFWSDPITLSLHKMCGKWQIKESHSSGGHSDDASEVERVRAFAKALNEVADLIETLQSNTTALDQAYETYKKYRAELEEARREELARIEHERIAALIHEVKQLKKPRPTLKRLKQ